MTSTCAVLVQLDLPLNQVNEAFSALKDLVELKFDFLPVLVPIMTCGCGLLLLSPMIR